jgi:hypothetical protein
MHLPAKRFKSLGQGSKISEHRYHLPPVPPIDHAPTLGGIFPGDDLTHLQPHGVSRRAMARPLDMARHTGRREQESQAHGDPGRGAIRRDVVRPRRQEPRRAGAGRLGALGEDGP